VETRARSQRKSSSTCLELRRSTTGRHPKSSERLCGNPVVSEIVPGRFASEEARRIGEEIGIDWSEAPFDVEQFRRGLEVELEHGLHDPATNVTGDDPIVTGKIALAHLNEFPDYYTRLERMEEEARRDHAG
jgi:hypothetical protein